jgi:hypothetical protein
MLSAIVVSFVLVRIDYMVAGGAFAGTEPQPVELHFAALRPKSDLRSASADIKSWQSGTYGIQERFSGSAGAGHEPINVKDIRSCDETGQSTDHAPCDVQPERHADPAIGSRLP